MGKSIRAWACRRGFDRGGNKWVEFDEMKMGLGLLWFGSQEQ